VEIKELIAKVKHLEIVSKKLTQHLFAGEYHSAFKGQGMLFKEVREYQYGEDTRFIDWNVSARFHHTYTKVFEEERELTVHFVIDYSSSTQFGTKGKTKKELIAELCAVLAFAALKNKDKTSLTLFTTQIEKHIPPAQGKQHVLRMVRDLLDYTPTNKGTNVAEALQFINKISNRKCIVFLVSDFMDATIEKNILATAKKHDLIGIKVYDPLEMQLPKIGLLHIKDLETGQEKLVDTNHAWVRENYQQQFIQHTRKTQELFNKAQSDLLHLKTDEDYVKILQHFFIKRLQRK
jgi:uncharacterized protein (DUF58 family)